MKSETNINPAAVLHAVVLRTRSIKVVVLLLILCFITPLYAADLTIDVNAGAFIRTIPRTIYGGSMTSWFGFEAGDPTYTNIVLASGQKTIRWPGGSWGDAYLWSDMEGPGGVNGWIVNYNEELDMLNTLAATMQPIVNFPGYWYDSLQGHDAAVAAAVAWVADQSARTPTAKYWEIGNETFGSWEAGWFWGISGTYYGDMFADFYIAMKAVNPDIKIGAVTIPYDACEPWFYEGLWTRDMLTAAKAKGVVPDFFSIHSYPGSNMGDWYNPIILSYDVDQIAVYTDNLNNIISETIGPEYVGQIEYCMTEWDAGGISHYNDLSYERWRLYSGAMFLSQYMMEMAKNGWAGSNSFGDFFYQSWMGFPYPDFYVYPQWYPYPFLTNKFGTEMVDATSDSPIVRAYAARDEANDLTIFIVNNSPDADLTAQINIEGLSAGTAGQSWLIQPAGDVPDEGTVQDVENLQINGIFHPDPTIVNSLPSQPFASGGSFEIPLPKSCMLFIKVPNLQGQRPYGNAPLSIPGTIQAENYDLGGAGIAYYDTTAGNSADAYRYDDVDIKDCGWSNFSVTGIEAGEWLEYTVEVKSTAIYEMKARVSSPALGGSFHITLDKMDITGPVSFSKTKFYTNVCVTNMVLNKGRYTMRLSMDSPGWNIDWLKFTKLKAGSGTILREWWNNVWGPAVADLTSIENFPCYPDGAEELANLEGPVNSGDIYGARIRGYLHPVADGNYTFWVAADDSSELWLSTDANPSNAVLIAYSPGWTNPREWSRYPQQQSSPVCLVAGKKYYIEVLHKEEWGGDNVAAAWQGPNLKRQVINGLFLSPYADAPQIICPENITLEATGPDGAVATFTASATDLCDDNPVITFDPCSGSTFHIGKTKVTCTATNSKGNSSTCTFKVIVVDTTPPVITPGNMVLIWPPNNEFHKFKLSDLVASVEDSVNGPLNVNRVGQIISIYSDEPQGPKDKCFGKNEPDIVILGDSSFKVRAQRAGKGNGRVYGVTFEVEDRGGNAALATCFIGVPHDNFGQLPVDDGPDAGYIVYYEGDWFRHRHFNFTWPWRVPFCSGRSDDNCRR